MLPTNAISPEVAMQRLERFMRMHGLAHWSYGWIREMDKATTYVALTYPTRHRIELSSLHLPFLDAWGLADAIKHEIAHARMPVGSGHNAEWQAMAVKIGALPITSSLYRKEYA